jgi:geranylgeranyl pyrophosphate synthase
MQSLLSSQHLLAQNSVLPLLDAVEAVMLASIRPKDCQGLKQVDGVREGADYHLRSGGRRVRTKIALQAGLAAGLRTADIVSIAAAVELLHNASLVHDDIQDGDKLRRGQQAVWSRFGVNNAICTGDLLLSAAYSVLCGVEKNSMLARMIVLVHERVSMAIDGQCAGLKVGALTLVDSTSAIKHYQQIAAAKSGALLSLPLELVLLAAGHSQYLTDAWHAVEAFAIGYQIVDDLHDMKNDLGDPTTQDACNIVSVFNITNTLSGSVDQAKSLGMENIDLAILLAQRLPFNIGECLIEHACQLRYALNEYKLEASIGRHK